MVGGLGRYGVVLVLRGVAGRVGIDDGQVVGFGSPQDPVAGYRVVLGVVPGEGQDAVADPGRREPGGSWRRVVLDGVIGFRWGCATGEGSCPIPSWLRAWTA